MFKPGKPGRLSQRDLARTGFRCWGALIFRGLSALIVLGLLLPGCGIADELLQASATPPPTQTPVNTAAPLPNLTILGVALQIDAQQICDPASALAQLQVRVANQGQAPSAAFFVEVNNERIQYPSGLAPQTETILSYPKPGFEANTIDIDIWVDVTGQVVESNEDDNHLVQSLPVPTPPPDCLRTPTPTVEQAEALAILEGHTASVTSLVFSPEGGLLASGSVDNTMRLWLVVQQSLLRTMLGHPFPVTTLDFSPDGALIATGSTDGLLRLWQVSNGRMLRTMEGHSGWISTLDFSPNGQFLASGSDDFTVRLWRSDDGRLVQTIDEGMAAINSLAFSADGSQLAWAEEDGSVRLRTLSGEWVYILKASSLPATALAISPDGDWIVAGYSDGALRVWDANQGTLTQILKHQTDAITSLAYSPDGRWLISGSRDATLRLWRVQESAIQETPRLIFAGHSAPVTSAAFSPRGDLAASASEDGSIRLWSIPAE
jgi:WD40 repeat protein